MEDKLKVLGATAFTFLIESITDHKSSFIVGLLTIIFLIVQIRSMIIKNRISKYEAKIKELEYEALLKKSD